MKILPFAKDIEIPQYDTCMLFLLQIMKMQLSYPIIFVVPFLFFISVEIYAMYIAQSKIY